ncbi:MAG: CBS domain-containing protein [Desulfovibrionales bacterium]|nr:CBS domain-containing protein [Desulfovibrionales bacterium]
MIIVTTHNNTDFDALASMVAAAFIYPEAVRLIPRQVSPPVREFLTVHWDILKLKSTKDADLSDVDHIIITDTSHWDRLDNLHELASKKDLRVTIWDHHMNQAGIDAAQIIQEEVGAATTLLVEQIKVKDCPFSPVHATLFLLGIYDDTGSLTFPSTTHRDARMAAFLLENGADLNVVSSYLDSSLDAKHTDMFSRMLSSSEIFDLGSQKIGICAQTHGKGFSMLPSVVNRLKEIKGLDAALGIFPMSSSKAVIIGRGKAKGLDLGAFMRKLGGGGHSGAGSATVKGTVDQIYDQVLNLLQQTEVSETIVKTAMTNIEYILSPKDSLRSAKDILNKSSRDAILIADQGRLLGMVGKNQLSKIRNESQWDNPVTSMMMRDLPFVSKDDSIRKALELMAGSEAGFLPVIENSILTGEVTRASIILNMYEF